MSNIPKEGEKRPPQKRKKEETSHRPSGKKGSPYVLSKTIPKKGGEGKKAPSAPVQKKKGTGALV